MLARWSPFVSVINRCEREIGI
jgi:hypothetical protein